MAVGKAKSNKRIKSMENQKEKRRDVQKVAKLLLTIAKNSFEVAERVNEETDIEGQEIPNSGRPQKSWCGS